MSIQAAAETRTGRPARDHDLAQRLAASAGCRRTTTAAVLGWMAARQRRNPFSVIAVPLTQLAGWRFAPESGNLVHDSGRFFTVEGIHVQTDYGPVAQWSQPIIDQPERSILGILVREIDGVLHFLMQAKMEPGNTGRIQLSPTVQATRSNCMRAHEGRRPPYVDYFAQPGQARVLVDVLQSEQGSWFRGKRNRNVVLEVTEAVDPGDDFIWLTLRDLYALLRLPNVVNMDTRTVLSCLPLPAATGGEGAFASALRRSIEHGEEGALSPSPEIASWLMWRKSTYELTAEVIPLRGLPGWVQTDADIRHRRDRFFRIVGVGVTATNREVGHWCQPMLAPRAEGLAAFIVRSIGGVLHALVRADVRPGYRDVVELGPTVQCTPANFDAGSEGRPAYLDLVLCGETVRRWDVLQSEEGGRFDRAMTRHVVVEVGPEFPLEQPPDFAWVTVAQLKELIRTSYQVNIEARSLVSCLHALTALP